VSKSDTQNFMLALSGDVENIISVMKELDTLELELSQEQESSGRSMIEIKANIKKLMTHPDVLESLDRLEFQGEPVWGLSSDERELIMMAREKVNEC
jgi:hypothetical protein